jgi:nicotinate-nucleotide adenylyltransferase
MHSQRLGVFGGTFDPIHIGHLILAEEARSQLKLDRVFFVPAGDPPHKRDAPLTPVTHRLCMVELAVADVDYMVVSRIDADRSGPHYTIDMMRLLQREVGENAKWYLLMGMDSLRDLPQWHDPRWLVEHCQIVALDRHDVTIDWQKLEADLPGIRDRVILLDMPAIEIASHVLRERVRTGQSIRYQVPRPVEAYIHKHGLYV